MLFHYRSYAIFSRDERPTPERTLVERRLRGYPRLRRVPADAAELLLVFGGDGTLLDAVRSRHRSRPHLLSFNTGRKGFLSTVRDPKRFAATLDAALAGDLVRLPVPAMAVTHRTVGGAVTRLAVNDVVIDCTMTWLTLRAESVRGTAATFVKEVRGSGLCVCSAIGSTTPMAAHFGAPSMDPNLRVFYLKGIHDAAAPASGVLLSGEGRRLRLTLQKIEPNPGIPQEHRRPPSLFVDGLHAGTLAAGDVAEVRYLSRPAVLLRLPDESSWDRLRQP